jgi:hypothetical protein
MIMQSEFMPPPSQPPNRNQVAGVQQTAIIQSPNPGQMRHSTDSSTLRIRSAENELRSHGIEEC